MLVCVIRATGVLGRVLVPLLLQQNHAVRALVRSPEKAQWLATAGAESAQCNLLAPNVANDLPSLLVGCDAVIHIATAIPLDFTALGAWGANNRLRTRWYTVVARCGTSCRH
jgi:uncharacterized protein YbjT (DUF2867 family)